MRVRLRRLAAAALAIGMGALPLPAAENTPPKIGREIAVKIGFVAFNSTEVSKSDEQKQGVVKAFLERVAQRAKPSGTMLHFDLVRGNYYQILHWMRTGDVDGAVLSPFMYDLLRGDVGVPKEKEEFPVAAEFPTSGMGSADDGGQPIFRAVVNGQPQADPEKELKRCLRHSEDTCLFSFVSHLSTSGFIYPLIHIYNRDDVAVPLPFDALLARSQFVLWHGAKHRDAATTIEFTYAADAIAKDPALRSGGWQSSAKKWQPLATGLKAYPPDVLVMSNDGPAEDGMIDVVNLIQAAAEAEAPGNPADRMKVNGYNRVQPAKDTDYDGVHSQVEALVQRARLDRYWRDWYTKEKYDFSALEIVNLLRNDQLVSGREKAALVLPGGGVRGAYQARMLDELYYRYVINDGFVNPKPADGLSPNAVKGRLLINSIVGTSGGALMGYLAARRSPCDAAGLTSRWIDGGTVTVTPTRVFPPFSALRFLSILLALLIFGLISVLEGRPAGTGNQSPTTITVGFAAILIGAPILMWRLSLIDYRLANAKMALLYIALLVVLHFLQTTMQPATPAAGGAPQRLKEAELLGPGVAIAGLLATALLAFSVYEAPSFIKRMEGGANTLRYWAIEAIVIAVFSVYLLGRSLGAEFDTQRAKEYGYGVIAMLAYLLLAGGILTLLAWRDQVTMLELTHDYWLGVLAASVAATLLILAVGRQGQALASLRSGVMFWVRRHGQFAPMTTLLTGSFVGVVAWIAFVAAALYGGQKGRETFQEQSMTVGKARTRFVAPVTALDATAQYPAGDYYAVEDDPNDPSPPSKRFLRCSGAKDDFTNAVSASGSPFPIYPASTVNCIDHSGEFTDGGFAHLVPVEGAVLLGAKQVLIVSNTARHDAAADAASHRTRAGSLLVSGVVNVFNYLFDRSQLTDVTVAHDVLVASIAPRWDRPDWKYADPFLMDFQPNTVRDLIKNACRNVSVERPAQVLSWGEPVDIDNGGTPRREAAAADDRNYRCTDTKANALLAAMEASVHAPNEDDGGTHRRRDAF